jgi:hypothetical protein
MACSNLVIHGSTFDLLNWPLLVLGLVLANITFDRRGGKSRALTIEQLSTYLIVTPGQCHQQYQQLQ